MTSLPNKPSELIRVALKDLKACEKDTSYHINMGEWHMPTDDGTCYVCLAGAVMAQTLGADKFTDLAPSGFEEGDLRQKLRAIDALRVGNITGTVLRLALPIESLTKVKNRNIVNYTTVTADQFHYEMNVFASDLKAVGL